MKKENHINEAPLRVAIDAHMIGEHETGNETYMVNLIRALAVVDDETHYLLYTPHPAALNVCGAMSETMQIRRVRPGAAPLRIPIGLPIQAARDRVNVLHVTYNAPPVAPVPIVATVHDISYVRYPTAFSPRDRLVLNTLVPLTLRRARHIITVSEHSRLEIIRHYDTPEDKISVTYQPVSPQFRPIDSSTCKEVGVRYGTEKSYILAVGNLQPRKNIVRLVRAFGALRKSGEYSGRLVLVGKTAWQGSQILDEVRRLGLREEVVLTGYVPDEDLVALYAGADVFVYPSLYEGFGLPPLEAMASGCPVITSNTSSLPEVVGDAAVTVDPTSEGTLAAAIARVNSDHDLRRLLIQRGLKRAASFSLRTFAESTRAVYERAATGRVAAPGKRAC